MSRHRVMIHIPSKEAMIAAVRKSRCSNLRDLPLEVMTAEDIYTHLVAAKCPCLQRLIGGPIAKYSVPATSLSNR
jgi:hypothetical protein